VGWLFKGAPPSLPYTAATALGGVPLGTSSFGPGRGAETIAALPFAAAVALLAGRALAGGLIRRPPPVRPPAGTAAERAGNARTGGARTGGARAGGARSGSVPPFGLTMSRRGRTAGLGVGPRRLHFHRGAVTGQPGHRGLPGPRARAGQGPSVVHAVDVIDAV